MAKNMLEVLVLVIGVAAWATRAQVPPPTQLNPNEWWGPKDMQDQANTTIRRFEIRFSDEMIRDLTSRLKCHRKLASPLEGTAFYYGFNTNQIDSWVKYWAEEYNFKEREAYFNQYPHFKTNIQGLDIHFLRVTPQVPADVTVVPLLVLHGWGGSFREFYEAIAFLTTPTDGLAFDVIVPSLPGFGFSDAAVRPGMGPTQMGVVLRNLMNRLGINQFYIQGGDWGGVIGTAMATMFQNEVLGFHTNMNFVLNSCTEVTSIAGALAATLGVPGAEFAATAIEETGFFHLQATKPDSLGVALTDSPVGFLAYMFEIISRLTKLSNRGLDDGGLYDTFTREQLIDNLMVYWVPGSITSSMRIYAEAFSKKHRGLRINEYSTSTPTWVLKAKHEFLAQPVNNLKFTNTIGTTTIEAGGHFLAFEMPHVYAADVFKAVKAFMKFYDTRTEFQRNKCSLFFF